jgi:DNA uptake protein ComE-like DNA-binding protein
MRLFSLAALTAVGLALGLASSPLMAQTPQTAPSSSKMAPAPSQTKMAPKQEPIDINTATEAQLDTLKGVGKARAEAIIKGRPYKAKDELVSKKIIPENVYNDIKDKIVAKQKS